MTPNKLLIAAGWVALATAALSAQPMDEDVRTAYEAIRPATVYSYCKTLCKPRYQGRYTGSAPYTECARWVASRFQKWGLRPTQAEAGYLQAFAAPHSIIQRASMTLHLPVAGDKGADDEDSAAEHGFLEEVLRAGEDFFPLLFCDGGERSAGVAFAGWGIHAPNLGYDDYDGLDVAGKFVLCFRGTPDRGDRRYKTHDEHRTRMLAAKQQGAVGLLYIQKKVGANPNGDRLAGFFPVSITSDVADRILGEHGLASASLRRQLEKTKRPQSLALSSRIHLAIEARHHADAVGYNVVAILRGSDPKLEHQCVVVGAHLDHCGLHAGLLFTGAQDNASGSAAVMAAAEAFSRLAEPPRRSVVFVLFGGEEMGLLGSRYFATHLPPGFDKVDGMFNLDMVGAGDGARVSCSWDRPALVEIIEQADQGVKTLRGSPGTIRHVGVRSSDFAPFFLGGAACANFSSNGPHLHYHRPGDTIYRINPDMLADVARITFLSSHGWANRSHLSPPPSRPRAVENTE